MENQCGASFFFWFQLITSNKKFEVGLKKYKCEAVYLKCSFGNKPQTKL